MRFKFVKMHGCGNDFLIFNGIQSGAPEVTRSEVQFLCDRHYGVGADGLVLLHKSTDGNDADWDFYNADGSLAEMCGNAARCVVRYLTDKYLPNETVSLKTLAGIVKGRVVSNDDVEISLLPQKDFHFEHSEHVLDVGGEVIQVFVTNTGVPHAVIEVKTLSGYPIADVGAKVMAHPMFQPSGTNVTFFERVVGKKILSTTYERGVHAETLACGTGAAAAALLYCERYMELAPITVVVPGGELVVDFSPVSRVLLLRGPVEYCFEVELEYLGAGFDRKVLYGKRIPTR